MAAVSGNVSAVQLLISMGADLNEIDKTLRTPLTHALYCGTRGTRLNDAHARVVSLLVTSGADLNVSVVESSNPLMSSVLRRIESMVRYFLSPGADPNVRGKLVIVVVGFPPPPTSHHPRTHV